MITQIRMGLHRLKIASNLNYHGGAWKQILIPLRKSGAKATSLSIVDYY